MASASWPPDADPLTEAQALLSQGRAAEAADRLTALIDAGRAGLLARTLQSRALILAGRVPEALASARETALLFPDAAAAAVSLGEALLRADHLPTAIGEFQRALRIDPSADEARYLLGCAWLEAGEPEKALQAFAALGTEGERPELAEKIALAERMRAAPRANAQYVRHLFDQFSGDYDSRMLGQLGYSAPAILRELAALVMPPGQTELRILDLGCGTGLAGVAFHEFAGRLDGIDLSPAMLVQARARGLYDDLRLGDIEAALPDGAVYDLVLAADTLVYLGDVAAVFANVFAALAPAGFFLFTVEKQEAEGFALGPKRRWRHSETYLREAAAHAGFAVAGVIACSPRSEAGVPVEGLALALQR
jgi:predicted TPR repeat methyltransferase